MGIRLTRVMMGILFCSCIVSASFAQNRDNAKARKVRDVVIYKDTAFYSTFPSVVKTKKGDLMVAFRRAPDRKAFGEKGYSHVDPNSYLVTVKSGDGVNWTRDPELLYAHAFGGSQDPCLLRLRDGTLLCASYGWAFPKPEGMVNLKKPYFEAGGSVFLGGYLLRSTDDGKSWQGPITPPHIRPEVHVDVFGKPIAAYNRGALYEGKDGRIFWVVAATEDAKAKRTGNHLLVSNDRGSTWSYSSPVASDEKIGFNEASVYETPKGDIVAFLRTAGMDDQACMARSVDGGKTFQPWQGMGFKGHPLQATRLPDNRVLLVYGYRHKPFGIRARILNAECTDFATAEEIVLRDDGGNHDIGYPWSVVLNKTQVLVVYYMNHDGGNRYIAGTILDTGSASK